MTTVRADRVSFDVAVHEVIGLVEMAVREVVAEINDPERQGGYFCFAMTEGNPSALPTLIVGVGTVPPEKGPKYLAFAQEKARRLFYLPTHRSSWQSRNPDRNMWGGAIAAGPYIFSFSGLPEHGDEAAMLLAAIGHGSLIRVEAATIASYSSNQLFIRMLNKLSG